MKRVSDSNKLTQYITKYELNKILNRDIINHLELVSYSKGELICSKDNELKYMFFLVEGKIKTYTLHNNGKSLLLRFSQPPSVFGDVEFLTNYKVYCNVESVGESLFIAIEMDKLRKYACEDTIFLKFIIENLSNKLYTSTNATSINLLYPLESRFASYLLSMIDFQEINSNYIEVKIPKLIEIAPMLGTSYRHLNRTVNEFVSRGIIQKSRATIIINSFEALKELSNGNIYEN